MSHQGLDAYLCCIVGADQYAVRGEAVRLVARAEQMRTGQGPDGRVGVLPFGGTEAPVFSLAALLGGTRDARTLDRHVVVAPVRARMRSACWSTASCGRRSRARASCRCPASWATMPPGGSRAC